MKFETPEHRSLEEQCIQHYLKTLGEGYQAIPTATYACVDWLVYDERSLREIVEIKCRTHDYGRYPDVFLEPLKRENALTVGRLLKADVKLLVGWMDAIGVTDLSAARFDLGQAGRTDRGAANDYGTKALLPIDQFRILEIKSKAAPSDV